MPSCGGFSRALLRWRVAQFASVSSTRVRTSCSRLCWGSSFSGSRCLVSTYKTTQDQDDIYLPFPGLWWLGASLLVAGSVIIGRREEGKESGDAGTAGAEPTVVAGGQTYSDEPDAPLGSRSGQALGGDLELVGSERRRSRSADRVGRVSAE
jgi:hypothetical protein